MKSPPPLPRSVQPLWDDICACRRCLHDPELRTVLREEAYVPFPTIGLLPPGARTPTYVLVGAEPNLGERNRDDLEERIERGLRNFGDGLHIGCVQLAVERYLLEAGEGYYFTDTSKCAMPVKLAAATRERRYALCSDYLVAEIELLRPRAIIAIGRDAFRYLRSVRRQGWPVVFRMLHYSAANVAGHMRLLGPGWDRGVPSRAEIDRFIESRRIESIHPKPFKQKANESHRRLLAAYREQFGVVRAILDKGSFAADADILATIPATAESALTERARALIARGQASMRSG